MGVSYDIRDSGRIVYATHTGTIDLTQITAMWQDYMNDPAFQMDRPHLVDLAQVTETEVGFSEVFSLFSMFMRHYEQAGLRLYIAINAPRELTFGLARIFQNLAESSDVVETAIFDDLDSARQWALAKTEESPAP